MVEHGRGCAASAFSLGSGLAPIAELDERYCSVFDGERSGGPNVRCKLPVGRSDDSFLAGRGFEKQQPRMRSPPITSQLLRLLGGLHTLGCDHYGEVLQVGK